MAIIAALPGELKPLVKHWRRLESPAPHVLLWQRPEETGSPDEVFALCAGMGAGAAERAFAATEARGPLDLVLSVGWAGALDPQLAPGDCSIISEVVDAQTGEFFRLVPGKRKIRLVTSAQVEDAAGKRELAQIHGAAMVDMEASAIARLARQRTLPMVCIKAISDGAGMELPNFNRFIGAEGQMRMAAFLLHVLPRPWLWGGLAQLGRSSRLAAERLATTITAFLAEKDAEPTIKSSE